MNDVAISTPAHDEVHVKLRLLGNTELISKARCFPAGDPLQRGLLAVLATRANSRVGVETLAAALWDSPPRTAPRQIQTRVWKLRELLDLAFAEDGGQHRPRLVNQAGGYLLFVEPSSIDLMLFNSFTDEARRAAAKGEFEEAAKTYRRALSLWRGPIFGGVSPSDISAPGIRAEAIKLHDSFITATEERIETDLTLGMHEELVGELQSLVRKHPLRERFWLLLIRALGRVGRWDEAVETYLEGQRLLVEEFGLDLSPDLTEGYRTILAARPKRYRGPGRGHASAERITVLTGTGSLSLVATGARQRPSTAAAAGLVAEQVRAQRRQHESSAHDRPPPHLEPVLAQLLAGATDLTASRKLGLSPRTFSRRVSELLDYLGVETRFQAGAEAHNRGWITTHPANPGTKPVYSTKMSDSMNEPPMSLHSDPAAN
ncbi:BTAD domain-containing putative transcriptional regulator [Streptomyces sp. NPDC048172]|uniref:BTAD domain-containing putative transcriptional regulator n=1 Tax=Streptomyces sp. NPDC048172 TaxID=3365505 RepID=UPI003712D1E3